MLLTSYEAPHGRNLLLIKENSPTFTNHDRLFKQLIEVYFEEFLEAFFPNLHKEIDFSEIVHLSEEVFTYDGDKRILDLVVEVTWKKVDAAIIIHIEPQSYVQHDFHERMFKYYGLLYNKLNKPIIPIAIFSYDDNWEEDTFEIGFAGWKVLQFNYRTLHLRKQNWHHFIKQDNPASAALLSKMGYTDHERVYVKLEFFKILVRLRLDKEKERMMVGFFESYLKLNEAEEEIFMNEARKLENADEIFEVTISYEEKGRKQGIKEGMEKGMTQGVEQGKLAVAKELLKKGMDETFIQETTKLSPQTISRLKKDV